MVFLQKVGGVWLFGALLGATLYLLQAPCQLVSTRNRYHLHKKSDKTRQSGRQG